MPYDPLFGQLLGEKSPIQETVPDAKRPPGWFEQEKGQPIPPRTQHRIRSKLIPERPRMGINTLIETLETQTKKKKVLPTWEQKGRGFHVPKGTPWEISQLEASAFDAVYRIGNVKEAAQFLGRTEHSVSNSCERVRRAMNVPRTYFMHFILWDRWQQTPEGKKELDDFLLR
jgi:hypothetical protein